jgi:NAD(P)H dehydrogenase (quinone)
MALAKNEILLVTGASGKFGRRVVEHLLTTYQVRASQIIATSRKPESLADFAAQGVTVRSADFNDDAQLVNAFAGATRLLIVSTDALDRPGLRLEQHVKAVNAAKASGVKHIVYTSMPKPIEGSPIPFAGDHRGTEDAITNSGMTYTLLRNSWYMENLAMSLPAALASGQWFVASGQGKTSHTAREDQARTAAAVLASGETKNATYTLTGPEALSADETAKIFVEVLGRPLLVIHLSPAQLQAGMIAGGVPEFLAPLFVSFDVNALEGNIDRVTDDIKTLSGTAPQTLRQWLVANKAIFGI